TAEAIKAQRTELTALTNRAAEAMTKAGYRASPAALERISNTLLGAAADRHLSEALRHGGSPPSCPRPGLKSSLASARERTSDCSLVAMRHGVRANKRRLSRFVNKQSANASYKRLKRHVGTPCSAQPSLSEPVRRFRI